MCIDAVLMTIDEIIKRTDEELLFLLKGQVIDPDFALEMINNYEDTIDQVLKDDLEYYDNHLQEFDDITTFYVARFNRMMLEDPLNDWITEANISMNSAYFFEMVPKYLMSTEPNVIVKAENYFSTKEAIFANTSLPSVDYITGWSEKLGDLMQITTQEQVTGAVFQALEEGRSIDWVRQQLVDLPGFSRQRARTTSLTEVLRADSYAANEAYITNPVVENYKWKHTGSRKNKPRPNHVALDGVEVPKGTNFQISGSEAAPFPRHESLSAKEAVNCHCGFGVTTDPAVTGLAAEEKKQLRDQAIKDLNDQFLQTATAESMTRINSFVDNVLPTIAGFTPAETIKDARSFAKDQLGMEKASYSGLELEAANVVNEEIFNFIQEYPELKGYVTNITTSKASTFGAKAVIGPNSAATEVQRTLRLSKTYWSDLDEYAQIYADEVLSGFKPAGSSFRDVIKHEMTHMLDYYITERNAGLLDGFTVKKWNAVAKSIGRNTTAAKIVDEALTDIGISETFSRVTAISDISKYAMYDPGETLAEAFVKAANNPGDQVSTSIISKLIEALRGDL